MDAVICLERKDVKAEIYGFWAVSERGLKFVKSHLNVLSPLLLSSDLFLSFMRMILD